MSIFPQSLNKNKSDHYTIGGIDVCELVQNYQTPLYILDIQTLQENCRHYTQTMSKEYPNSFIAYAGKANLNKGVLNILARENVGLDVVSGGELYTALQTPLDRKKILFHGNNKSLSELELAIKNDILIVLDNFQEISNIGNLAHSFEKKVNVLIRLKPEINVDTHQHIQTGHVTSKFGFDLSELESVMKKIQATNYINYKGIHAHLGSQLFDIVPYKKMIRSLATVVASIKQAYGCDTPILNIGGGIGIQYTKEENPIDISHFVSQLCNEVKQTFHDLKLQLPQLVMEPGRSLIGNAGVTIYTIGTIKKIKDLKNYLFVDGGMADNPRPIMYQSNYTMAIANKSNESNSTLYTVAGKFCESGDILANEIMLPEAEVGDLLIVFGTGAYNYSMASNYNKSCKPAMITVHNNDVQVIIKRETYDDLLRNELG